LTTQGSNAFPQNARDFTNWYGPSDYDVRHRLTANFVVNLPLGDNIIARDWVASGVCAIRSGQPFTVNQSNNNVGQSMYGLPDAIGDPSGPKTVDRWFNTDAFTPVASGVFGNEIRNQLRGPAFQSFDLTLQRLIRVGNRYTVSFRWMRSICSTRPPSDCRTRTLPAVRRSAPSPACLETHGRCSCRCVSCFSDQLNRRR